MEQHHNKIISNIFWGSSNTRNLKDNLSEIIVKQLRKNVTNSDFNYLASNMKAVFKPLKTNGERVDKNLIKKYILEMNNDALRLTVNGINEFLKSERLKMEKERLDQPVAHQGTPDKTNLESINEQIDNQLEDKLMSLVKDREINEPVQSLQGNQTPEHPHDLDTSDILNSLNDSFNKAPQPHKTPQPRQEKIINIDSNARDKHRYPCTNNYKLEDLDIRGVVSVELLGVDIQKNNFNITTDNNLLHFEETKDDIKVASITPGFYNNEELVSEISFKLNNTGVSTYKVTLNNSGKIILESIPGKEKAHKYLNNNKVHFFSMYADTHSSILPTLGYQLKHYKNNLKYEANTNLDLELPRYILLYIPELSDNALYRMSLNDTIKINNKLVEYDSPYRSYEPLKMISTSVHDINTLTIQFKTYDGKDYNTGGLENSVCLNVIN